MLAKSSVSPINNRTARSSRLLTSVAEARRVSQASKLDSQTSEITRAMWYWSSVGSPSAIARANMESMSFSTWSTSLAAEASAKT